MPATTIIYGLIVLFCGFYQFRLLGSEHPTLLLDLVTYGGMLIIAGLFSFKMRILAAGAGALISIVLLTKRIKNLTNISSMDESLPQSQLLGIEFVIAAASLIYAMTTARWLLKKRREHLSASLKE